MVGGADGLVGLLHAGAAPLRFAHGLGAVALGITADALEDRYIALEELVLFNSAVAVGVGGVSLGHPLAEVTVSLGLESVVLTQLQGLILRRLAAVHHIHGAAEAVGIAVGIEHDVAGIPLVLNILGAVLGVAGVDIEGPGGCQGLALADLPLQAALAVEGDVPGVALLLPEVGELVEPQDVVHIVVAVLKPVAAVHAIGHDHVDLIVSAAGPLAHGHAVNAGAGEAVSVILLVGGIAVSVLPSEDLGIQGIPEVHGGLREQHAGDDLLVRRHIVDIHAHRRHLVGVKDGQEELLAGGLILQRAIDMTVVVVDAAQVGAALHFEAAGPEVHNRRNQLAGLNVDFGQGCGVREVHIFQLLIHADALQMGCTSAQAILGGVHIVQMVVQSDLYHGSAGARQKGVGLFLGQSVSGRFLGHILCGARRDQQAGQHAKRHQESQEPLCDSFHWCSPFLFHLVGSFGSLSPRNRTPGQDRLEAQSLRQNDRCSSNVPSLPHLIQRCMPRPLL